MTTDLETHIAHHAEAIDDISKQMADQWAAIRRLEAKLDRIIGHLRTLQDEGESSAPPASVPPPHY